MIFAQPFRRLSSSLPHLVNFFGERGGFDAMIFRIEDANNKPPLKMVFLYLKVLEEVLLVTPNALVQLTHVMTNAELQSV